MKNATYIAFRREEDKEVYASVLEENTSRSLRHVPLHSPTGFEFGYQGSGPADLALAILIEELDGPTDVEAYRKFFDAEPVVRRIRALYQAFKTDVVAPKRGETWWITSGEIAIWLEEFEKRHGALCTVCGGYEKSGSCICPIETITL